MKLGGSRSDESGNLIIEGIVDVGSVGVVRAGN